MDVYEYKVVPAPMKGQKARGVRKSEDKFAFALQEVMNSYAQDGWEFLRSETLPNEERVGLTNTSTTYRSILVFRRFVASETPAVQPAEPEQAKVTPTRVTVTEAPKQLPKPAPEKAASQPEPVENEEDFFDQAQNMAPPLNASSLPAALRMRAERKQAANDLAAE